MVMSDAAFATQPRATRLRNYSLKEDVRAYWSGRALTFDLSTGHRIEDSAEAAAWQALFRSCLDPVADKHVLDLACGTGEISRMLLALGAHVTGVDFAEPMLERAKAKNAGRRFRASLGDVELLLSEGENVYDAVVTRHLVWTLIDPHAAFERWFQVLKPGGQLLIVDGDWVTTPLFGRFLRMLGNRLSPRRTIHGDDVDMDWHQRILEQVHYREGLTPEKLIPDLQAQGFSDIRQHSTRGIYWWGMRKAPLADRLRLMAPRRFAISARKPG